MSDAEYFLMGWAVSTTILAGYFWSRAKHFFIVQRQTSVLLAELACGDIQAVQRPDGFTVIENDQMKLSFKRRGKND
jgi:hypothetical protein